MDVFAELQRLGSLIRQLQGALQGERRVRGVINTTTPSIIAGTGFTVSKVSAGFVTITFTTAFADIPAVTPVARATSIRIAQLVNATTTSTASVGINTLAGAAADGEFHFIAVGPP